MAVTPAHAETIEARFSKANDKYIFTVSSDSLPALNDPEFGKAYQSAIVFRNDSGADMKVTLAEVKELTNNTDVYARSYEHIYDDTKDYYNGSISKSAFETVLKPGGTLVFKWCEYHIPLRDVLACFDQQPVLGNKKPAQSKTHWLLFYKPENSSGASDSVPAELEEKAQ